MKSKYETGLSFQETEQSEHWRSPEFGLGAAQTRNVQSHGRTVK